MRYRELVFRTVEGRDVPCQPWPQTFYISGWLAERDEFQVRPLTLTGLVRGVGKNLITMTYWRFMVTLRVLGFLSTPETCRLSWSHWNWTPWRYQLWWRLRIVRFAKWLWLKVQCAIPVTKRLIFRFRRKS